MEDDTSLEVLNVAKETLLEGLCDENQGLQSVLKFNLCFMYIRLF